MRIGGTAESVQEAFAVAQNDESNGEGVDVVEDRQVKEQKKTSQDAISFGTERARVRAKRTAPAFRENSLRGFVGSQKATKGSAGRDGASIRREEQFRFCAEEGKEGI